MSDVLQVYFSVLADHTTSEHGGEQKDHVFSYTTYCRLSVLEALLCTVERSSHLANELGCFYAFLY